MKSKELPGDADVVKKRQAEDGVTRDIGEVRALKIYPVLCLPQTCVPQARVNHRLTGVEEGMYSNETEPRQYYFSIPRSDFLPPALLS